MNFEMNERLDDEYYAAMNSVEVRCSRCNCGSKNPYSRNGAGLINRKGRTVCKDCAEDLDAGGKAW